jgi:CheY-like chemotaxis protein
VLNDILDFTKLEAGHFKISAEPFSLRNLVEEVRRLMQPIADDKHLIMSMHVTDSVPDRVCGDAHRLHQVLCNLVGNAVKFTDTGRIDVVVRVTDRASTDPDIHWIRFDVRDTGTGISDDKLGDLFQPFSQLDASTSRRHSGTGLGLAIVRQLLDLMNGEVGVESTIGIGSLFWIEVPLPLSASAAYLDITHDTGIGQRADDPGAIATMPSLRILVAEDNAINQTLIQIYLTERRHRVMIVGDGQAAIEQAQTADYDLVLMDMRMPGVDGAEAIRSIRKGDRNQYTAIYALTADILLSSAVQGVRAMLDGVLAKPIEFKLLDEVLERVARGRSGHRRFCDTSMG